MKVLEVSTLHPGIDQVLNNHRTQQEQLKQIEKSIQGIVNLDDSFKGMGGQAIRGYYDSNTFLFYQHC